MKLEIKHLAPYLPYGLMIDASYYDEEKPLIISYIDNNLNAIVLCGQNVGAFAIPIIQEYDLDKAKPILKPLSELTKEELRTQGFGSHIDYLTHENKGVEWTLKAPYEMVNYLFEKHYDVFRLIDQGLAIDINTLNK